MTGGAGIEIRFWGVRGSYPVPGPATAKTGGNSSCVEMRAGGKTMVFDAGTGIIGLGAKLLQRTGAQDVHIFLSHLHHDHIEGLRFFKPLYRENWQCHLYGLTHGERDLRAHLEATMHGHYFPVEMRDLKAHLDFHTIEPGEPIVLGSRPRVVVEPAHCRAHPRYGVTLYRLRCGGKTVVYATDVEAPVSGYEEVVRFASGADVLIHDAQYTDREYFREVDNRQGWGHSTVRMAAETARAAGVGQLILYHHDPARKDPQIAPLERLARTIFPRSKAAREGMTLRLR